MRAAVITALVLVATFAALWLLRSQTSASVTTHKPAVIDLLPDVTLPDLNDQPRSLCEYSVSFQEEGRDAVPSVHAP